ncbi:hypothetical protein IKZ40_04610 [bacterium]|nr:hypothetical protein [bacterium]
MTNKMKKWLYGVALGALLVAGNVAGITVQEVLNTPYEEYRGNSSDFFKIFKGYYRGKYNKESHTVDPDGTRRDSFLYTISCPKLVTTRWKYKEWYNGEENQTMYGIDNDELLKDVLRGEYKETTTTHRQEKYISDGIGTTNYTKNIQETYTVKPLKKSAHPMSPLVVDDWFSDHHTGMNLSANFYGTEHTAVTNIISDNEAYITGTIRQSGYINEYYGFIVEEPTSLVRTYTQHITTDADHVYVTQDINEKSQFFYNEERSFQTQYTAKYKKGRWKNVTETISNVAQGSALPWLINYYNSLKQNSR